MPWGSGRGASSPFERAYAGTTYSSQHVFTGMQPMLSPQRTAAPFQQGSQLHTVFVPPPRLQIRPPAHPPPMMLLQPSRPRIFDPSLSQPPVLSGPLSRVNQPLLLNVQHALPYGPPPVLIQRQAPLVWHPPRPRVGLPNPRLVWQPSPQPLLNPTAPPLRSHLHTGQD